MAVEARSAKRCSSCGDDKRLSDFHKASNRPDGLNPQCKSCRSAYGRATYSVGVQRDKNLRANYGISLEDFEGMLWVQDNRCAICAEVLLPPGVCGAHVDHDHASGRVRGILCHDCNLGLGRFHDDPEALRSAASYLEAC